MNTLKYMILLTVGIYSPGLIAVYPEVPKQFKSERERGKLTKQVEDEFEHINPELSDRARGKILQELNNILDQIKTTPIVGQEAPAVEKEKEKQLQAERIKQEAERIKQEEAERIKQEEAERIKQEEAERIKQEEAERQAEKEQIERGREERARLEQEEKAKKPAVGGYMAPAPKEEKKQVTWISKLGPVSDTKTATINKIVTRIQSLIKNPDAKDLATGLGSGDPLASEQQKIMTNVLGEIKNFDENNLQDGSNAQSIVMKGLSSKNDMRDYSREIDRFLMTAACALANIDGGAGSEDDRTAIVNKVNTALNLADKDKLSDSTNSDLMLELAVKSPLIK